MDFFERLKYDTVSPKAGRLLISEPFLMDPNFRRTVIFLVECKEEGAVGFILNRSLDLSLQNVVEGFPALDTELFSGGPVNPDNLFYLHTIEGLKNRQQVIPGLYWGGDFEELKNRISAGMIHPEDIRFYAGYSGWEKGQLVEEINDGSWIVAKTNARKIMQNDPETLWKDTLDKMGEKYKVISMFPEDPTLN